MKGSILEIEVDARNRSVLFAPAGRKLPGRVRFLQCREPDAVSGLSVFGLDHVPGAVIGVDERGGYIRSRLAEAEYSTVAAGAQRFGTLPPERESLPLDAAGRNAWLWAMRRLVEQGHAVLLGGEFPAGLTAPAPAARSSDPLERMTHAIEALLARLAPARA